MNRNIISYIKLTIIPFGAIHKQQMEKVMRKTKYLIHLHPARYHLIPEQQQLPFYCEQLPTSLDYGHLSGNLNGKRESDGPTTTGVKYTNL